MAHNVPCPSCGHDLTLGVADDRPNHRDGWAHLEADLRARHLKPLQPAVHAFGILDDADFIQSDRQRSTIPTAEEANAEYQAAMIEAGTHPFIEAASPMVLDPNNAETPLSWAEEPPALAPTERRYLVEITATYEGGEPISSPEDFALFVQAYLTEDSQQPWLKAVKPLVRVELEACEPMQLLNAGSEAEAAAASEVYVRLSGPPFAPGCPTVELLGGRAAVLRLISDQWDMGQAELDELGYELR